jgi:hypothetical protein
MAPRKHTVARFAGIERRNSRVTDRWHLGKEIPLTVIGLLVAQTAGYIWWLSHLSFTVDNAVVQMSEYKAERYTREDARRDRELLDQRFQAQKLIDNDIERRTTGLEARIDRLERK